MKNKLTITPDLTINAIMVCEPEKNLVFRSENICMSLHNYMLLCDMKAMNHGSDRFPHILNYELDYMMDASGVTSNGHKYQASAYFYKSDDIIIVLSVVHGVEIEVGTDVYEMA